MALDTISKALEQSSVQDNEMLHLSSASFSIVVLKGSIQINVTQTEINFDSEMPVRFFSFLTDGPMVARILVFARTSVAN